MADVDVRIVELIAAKSVFEVGGGRPGLFGYENEAATLRMQIGASPTANVIYLARRDVAQTFSGDQTFSGTVIGTQGSVSTPSFTHQKTGAHDATRFVLTSRATSDSLSRFVIKEGGLFEWGPGTTRDVNLYRSAVDVLKTDDAFDAASLRVAGVTRITSGGAGAFTGVTDTSRTAGQVLYAGAGGVHAGSTTFTYDDAAGVAVLTVGSATNTNVARLSLDSAAGYTRYIRIRTGAFGRWAFGGGAQTETGISNAGTDFEILALTDVGGTIDTPFSIVRAAGGAATITRPLKLPVHTADRVLTSGVGGEVSSDTGWQVTRVSGVTRRFTLGDGAVAGFVGGLLRRSPGNDAGWAFREDVAAVDVSRWELRHQGSDGNFVLSAHGTNGAIIDLPFTFANASGAVMTFGGTTLRPANFTGAVQTSGVTRISAGGAGTFTSVTSTNLTATQVLYAGTGGALAGDSGLTIQTIGGVTRQLALGDYATANDVFFVAKQTSGQLAGFIVVDGAQNRRWSVGISTGTNFRIGRWTNSSTKIDDPIDIVAGSAGLITIGGASNSTTNFTGAIQTSGVTRISSGGAGTMTTLLVSGLAGSGTRPLVADASGNLAAQDAATFRTTIGAASSAGSVAYEALFTGRRTTAGTNGVMTTAVIPTKTFAANFWTAGKMVEGRAQLYIQHAANIAIKLGGNAVANFTIPDVFRGQLRVWITCETAGASGTFAFHAQADWALTSTPGAQSPYFGDSVANGGRWSDSWTVNTTTTTTLSWEVTPTYTEDIDAIHGSLVTHTP